MRSHGKSFQAPVILYSSFFSQLVCDQHYIVSLCLCKLHCELNMSSSENKDLESSPATTEKSKPKDKITVGDLAENIETILLPKLTKMIAQQVAVAFNVAKESEAATIRTSSTVPNTQRSVAGKSSHLQNEDETASETGEILSDDEIEVDLESMPNKWLPPDYTVAVVNDNIKRPLSKTERREIFYKFPLPAMPSISMPKIDDAMQQIMKQRAISIRKIHGLAEIETCQKSFLNIASPLIHLHGLAVAGLEQQRMMDCASVIEALDATFKLMGNANSVAIAERRKALLTAIHPQLGGYSYNETSDSSSTCLFGQGLFSKLKDSIDLNTEINKFTRSLPTASSNGKKKTEVVPVPEGAPAAAPQFRTIKIHPERAKFRLFPPGEAFYLGGPKRPTEPKKKKKKKKPMNEKWKACVQNIVINNAIRDLKLSAQNRLAPDNQADSSEHSNINDPNVFSGQATTANAMLKLNGGPVNNFSKIVQFALIHKRETERKDLEAASSSKTEPDPEIEEQAVEVLDETKPEPEAKNIDETDHDDKIVYIEPSQSAENHIIHVISPAR